MKGLIRWGLRRFERRYDYDTSYVQELLATDLGAFRAFARVSGMSAYRKDIPVAPWYAAKVVGAMREDCGPCTQLVVRMAEEAGVDAGRARPRARGR